MPDDKIIESPVGDIHMRGKGTSQPIDTSFEFTPQNPFTVDIANEKPSENIANPGFEVEPEKTGFIRSAIDEFEETSSNAHVSNILRAQAASNKNQLAQYYYPDVNERFGYKPTPEGWTPKQEIEKISNLDPKYLPRLLKANSPQDFQYRLNDLNEQTQRDKELQNGSTFGKIVGGLVGYSPIGSIENFIPFASIATKAKVGSSFLSAAMKAAPSMLGASAIREGAMQMDKIDANLPDFIKDTFVDAAFGTVFLGAIGGGKSLLNLSEFNRLKDFSKKYLQGVGFNYVVDAKGELKGFKAVDASSDGSLSAEKVTKAQEMADAAFHKGGLFKVPYVGAGTLALISGNIPGFKEIFGSPLVRMINSKYKASAAFANSAFDHFISTVGDVKGETRAPSFEFKVKKTRALITKLNVLTSALHAERNGYNITARPAIGIQNAWSAMKQKTIETLSQESKSTNYVSKDDFHDEIQSVLYSGQSSEHASVNEAASLYRKVIDDTYKDYREAHGLPTDWLPPKTATNYLMRVYDTNYLNSHEGMQSFTNVVSKWFKDSDELIGQHMQPINDLKQQIKNFDASTSKVPLKDMKTRLTAMQEQLQDKLREDPSLLIHADDWNNFSAKEAKELTGLLKPVNDIKEEIEAQKSIIKKAPKESVEAEKVKLKELEDKLFTTQDELNERAHKGELNPRFFSKDENSIKFKDPENRLKFRDTYESDFHRETAAKASYDSIMNLKPEDIVSDVFGKITGNQSENPLKRRTLMIPDEILYNNNFMSKDLVAKTANYVNYLSKRTHLKTSFQNVTVNGGYEELASGLLTEYKSNLKLIDDRIDRLNSSLEKAEGPEKKKIQKDIEAEKKNRRKESRDFVNNKDDMKYLYETRMMGLNKRHDLDTMIRRTWMALTAAFNLHNLPATQVTDLAWGGFQHGIWPMTRDAVYPIIHSMAGMLKTKDSEALREMAPHVNLGYQDAGNNYADRNWSSELQPMINMGRIVGGAEKIAHFSAITDLSTYIDNGVQRAHGSVIQSRFMELLHKSVNGSLSEKDSLYLRKYGIDPKKWGDRMVNAYKDAQGFKTKLGGYISKAWQWQDMEAANVFNDAVFRGVQNTLVWKGMADSPFFADNILGLFFHTFTGWGYAATNRYLIPSLQHPDAELLIKMLWMTGAGALVSPTRRIARGEQPWPDDMTPEQISYEAFTDSGILSTTGNVLNVANFMMDDKLLGDLKNDKFRNRVKTGIFGMSDVVSSTAGRVGDVLGMAKSGLNEKDMKTAAHMLPITGAMYGHYISDKLIEGMNLPRNKRAAESQ